VIKVAAEFRPHGVEEPTNNNGNGKGNYNAVLRKLREVLDSFQEIEGSHILDPLCSEGAEQ